MTLPRTAYAVGQVPPRQLLRRQRGSDRSGCLRQLRARHPRCSALLLLCNLLVSSFVGHHAGTDEPLLVGAVAATVVAITHLFAIVSMPVMGSIILSMEVAVLTVMVAMIAMGLIVVAVVVMAVPMFVSKTSP